MRCVLRFTRFDQRGRGAGGRIRCALPLLLLVAFLAMAVNAPAASAATLYANFGGGPSAVADETSQTKWRAQSFVPTTSGTARLLSFWTTAFGANVSTSVAMSIYTDAGGNPGSPLATATAGPIGDSTGSAPTCALLDEPTALTAGQTYWAVFRSTTATEAMWYTAGGGPSRLSLNSGATWGAAPNTYSLRVEEAQTCAPDISTIPSPLPSPNAELGDMYAKAGGTGFQTLSVSNTGIGELTLDGGSFSGPNASMFRLLDGEPEGRPPGSNFVFPQSLGVGGGGVIFMYIVCAPPEGTPDGEKTATFTLTSNDPDEDPISWPVWCLVDSTPPSLEFILNPDGSNGWYVTRPAPIQIRGVDPESGNRVKRIFCSDNAGASLDWGNGSFASFGITPDGVHNLSCQGTDAANNTSAPGAFTTTVKVDATPPATTDDVPANYVKDDVTVTLSASDATSGVNKTYYTTGTNPADPTTASSVYNSASKPTLGDGEKIKYFSTDNAGNAEVVQTSPAAKVDKLPPVTADDVPASYVKDDVTVTLNASDAASGVDKTYYTTGTNPADPTTASSVYNSASKPTLGDGEKIKYFSTDKAGNVEVVHTSPAAKVDKLKPTTGDNVPASYVNNDVTVTLTPSDTGGSGLDKTYYTVGTNPADPTTASSVYDQTSKPTLGDGEKIKYFSTDKAGNPEAVRTSSAAKVDKLAPETGDNVSASYGNNDVTVTLASSDTGGSGLDKTYYTVGTNPADPTTASSVYNSASKPTLGDGEKIKYFSTDKAGNAEAVQASPAVKVDKLAPTTGDDVPASYVKDDVTVTLNASDSGSGVEKTYYTTGTNPADPTTASSVYDPASKPVLGDGERIKYFSTDEVGNVEAVRSSPAAKVDKAAPSTSDDVPPGLVNGAVTVTLASSDTGGSGHDRTYYTLGTNPPDPTTASSVYDPASKPKLGDGEKIKYFSTDKAGNPEAVRTSGVVKFAGPPPGEQAPPNEGSLPGGDRSPVSPPSLDSEPPLLTALRPVNARFMVIPDGDSETLVDARTKRGTKFVFSLSEPARVLFTLERKGRRAYSVAGRFAVAGLAGQNHKRFSGRLGNKMLEPGLYRALLVATDAAGNRSQTKRRYFRILAP